jgi:signal-transduction protein with cAMP-binding, CBS, and nucleotidyltransferase domain
MKGVKDMEEYFDDIGDYMSSPVLSIDSELTVQEAAQQMHAKNVGALLVRLGEEYVGIVTETDLARKVVALGLDLEATMVSSVMTKPFFSMDRYIPVEEAEEFMKKNKIRHLAVTEEDEVVGMISVKDLVLCYSKAFKMTE